MESVQKTRTGSNAVKLTVAKIITMAVSLVSSMLLSRFRSLTEYGTYSQLLMAINLVSSLFMLGLPNSINYFLGKSYSDKERTDFLSVYYTLNTILSFIIGLVLVLAIPFLEQYFKNELIKSFWYFLAVYPWTKVIMSSTENLLICYNKNNVLMAYKILNSSALLGAILLIQAVNGSFRQYMILFLSVEVVFTAATYFFAKKNSVGLKPSLNKELIKTILTFSIPIGFASMLGTINIELDKLVITSMFSTEDLAVYTNASKELPVTIIATSLTAVLLPQAVKYLSNNQKKEAVDLWKSATTISFSIIGFIAVACIVFAPEVLTVLYSEKYLAGVGVFRVYSIVLLLRCTYFGMMLNSMGKTKFILYSSVGTLLLNFLLNYLFYYLFGFIGPAIATLLATTLMNLLQLVFTAKKMDYPFKKIFPWKNCGIYLLINVLFGAAIYFAKMLAEKYTDINSIILAIGFGIIWFALYAIAVFKPLKKQWLFLNKER